MKGRFAFWGCILSGKASWSDSFGNSRSKLIAAARQAREEILQGKAMPMNVEDL
jgi:hypothetical protein